jgi:protein SCO1/2
VFIAPKLGPPAASSAGYPAGCAAERVARSHDTGPGLATASAAPVRRRSLSRIGPTLTLLLLGLFLGGCGGSSRAPQGSGPPRSRFDGIPAAGYKAPNFALHDQHGQLIRLSAERGKFVVITFLYVHCTNVCPVIAQQLNRALRDLPPAARDDVRVLAVSVDPKGDTPSAVAHFIAVHRLLPQFLYLTGTAKALEPVWAGYHIASTQTGKGVVVGHTAIEILLNRSGAPQTIYDATVTPEQVLHDLRVLGLQE